MEIPFLPCLLFFSTTLLALFYIPVQKCAFYILVQRQTVNHARISAYKSLVYLSISDVSRLGKFYSMKFIKEKFTEEQEFSRCVGYCAPEKHLSMLNNGLKSSELFLDMVKKSKASVYVMFFLQIYFIWINRTVQQVVSFLRLCVSKQCICG